MRVNIISNITNGAGLERDFHILRRLLLAAGHQVAGVKYDAPTAPHADLNIWLEIIMPEHALEAAPRQWLIPNSEWWYPQAWDKFLDRFERVLCKTHDCLRIWSAKVGARALFTGFEALDFYDASIARQPTFLHMAGKSETKNTAAVIAAWRQLRLPYCLTAVAWKPNIAALCQDVPQVTHIVRVPEDHMPRLMNEYLFHLMPSKYEGYGHYIHEALGCGGLVITTDAPPMNESAGVARELLIPARQNGEMRIAPWYEVTPAAIAEAVKRAVTLSRERVSELRSAARAAFLSEQAAFREAFQQLVA